MRTKVNIFLTSVILLTLSDAAISAGFNDNYVQLAYTSNNYKHDDNTIILSGSKELKNDLILLGRYSYMTADWNDPGEYEKKTVKTMSVGIGKAININHKSDFISSIMYSDYDSKQVCTNTDGSDCTSSYSNSGILKTDYYTINLGIRHLFSSDLQTNIEYSLDMLGALDPQTKTISVGVMTDVAKDVSIGLKVSSSKKPDADEAEVYIRRSF